MSSGGRLEVRILGLLDGVAELYIGTYRKINAHIGPDVKVPSVLSRAQDRPSELVAGVISI